MSVIIIRLFIRDFALFFESIHNQLRRESITNRVLFLVVVSDCHRIFSTWLVWNVICWILSLLFIDAEIYPWLKMHECGHLLTNSCHFEKGEHLKFCCSETRTLQMSLHNARSYFRLKRKFLRKTEYWYSEIFIRYGTLVFLLNLLKEIKWRKYIYFGAALF